MQREIEDAEPWQRGTGLKPVRPAAIRAADSAERISTRRTDCKSVFLLTAARIFLHALMLALPVSRVAAADAAPPPVSFRKDLAPLLQRRCAGCHGEENAKGGYRLDSFAKLRAPGDSGDAPVIAGKPRESVIFKVLIATDPDERMPQKADPLPAAEIAMIERWLGEGAVFDGGDAARPIAELARETHLRPAPPHYARPLPVTALAFNHDGQTLASSGYHEVLLWHAADGTLARRIGGLPERIQSLAWNPKADVLAVAGGTPGQWGTVALADPAGRGAVQFLCDLPEVALGLAFSPDGKWLAAACGDKTIRVFEMPAGRLSRVLRNHSDWVQSVAFSPDGKSFVSASRDRSARVFDVFKWEVQSTYRGFDVPLLAAVFSADGSRIFATARGGIGHSWQPEKPDKHSDLTDFDGDVRQLAAGSFGVAAGCADGSVRLYRADQTAPYFTLRGHSSAVQSVAAAAKTGWIASGDAAGEVIVWSFDCATWLSRFTATP